MFERALEINEKVYAQITPVCYNSQHLGGSCKIWGFRGGQDELREAIEIDEKAYGTNNPNLARDIINLADSKRFGDIDDAMNNLKKAIMIDEKVYGPEHAKVARDVSNLD